MQGLVQNENRLIRQLSMSDKDLIKGCIAKDPASQDALLKRYAGKMIEVCRSYIQDELVVERVIKKAFNKIFANIKDFTFRGENSLQAWIRSIVTETALSALSEAALVKGCMREDRRIQNELFNRYAGKMLSVARRYARHEMEAEDILYKAISKVYDNIETKKNGSLEGWIRTIVINTALRNRERHSFKKEKIGISETDELRIKSADPKVFSTLAAEELLQLIAQLPDTYREIFNLVAIEGYSHKEVATMMNIKEATSRSNLAKARKKLILMLLESD